MAIPAGFEPATVGLEGWVFLRKNNEIAAQLHQLPPRGINSLQPKCKA
ncbi:hypothetical protein PsAD13_03254 [Pseudovibrio sp. Ad13]|nr:hypothetical protein PsAD13_03254 [Pseudovibrio sp. Ad13]